MRNTLRNFALLAAIILACASAPAPDAYLLAEGAPAGDGRRWSEMRASPLARERARAYPAFFAVVLDPAREQDPDTRPLRDDLESRPAGPHSYRALNAVAFAYFELNYRAQSDPGGRHYLADSFRAAKIVAIPWRAYGEIEDPALRHAILDFFADAASGAQEMSRSTAPRLLRVVDSLRRKEADPERIARIDAIVATLAASTQPPPLE